MANPTIKNSLGTTFTFAAGEIKSVRSVISADVEQLAFPGIGPALANNFDFNGPLKLITISGDLFETTASRIDTGSVTTILEQKQWLEGNINGFQSAATFTSTYDSQTHDGSSFVNTQILFGQLDINETSGEPEFLPFTLSLLVGVGL